MISKDKNQFYLKIWMTQKDIEIFFYNILQARDRI